MSLYNTINRATQEAEQLKSDKQLNQSIKDYEIRNALQFAIIEELKKRTIKDLKKSDVKFTIIKNTLYETIADIIANDTEEDFYFYKMQDIYDKELAKIEKQEKQKQKEIEQEQQEAEKVQAEKIANKQNFIHSINIIINGVIISLLVIFAPFLLISFVIYFILKNMK